MYSLFSSIVNIIFSLILGAIAMGICAYYFPEYLEIIQIQASTFKDWFLGATTQAGVKSGVNIWIRFILADEQLVFMFFVVLARISIFLILSSLGALFSKNR